MKATFPLSTVKSKFKPISRYCTWSQSNQFGLKFSHTQTNTSYVFLGKYEKWYFFLSYLWCDLLIKFIIRSIINMRGWNTIPPYLMSVWEFSNLRYLLLSALHICTNLNWQKGIKSLECSLSHPFSLLFTIFLTQEKKYIVLKVN